MAGNHRLQRIRGRHHVVVAYLALFVALSGTAVAAKPLIEGADVQNESLTTADIRNESLTGDDILESSLGKVGDADTLDGQDSTDFLGVSGKAADADTLDGQDSTDFLGVSGKAADADRLDGLNSTAFLGASAKAADAEKLDGLDGSAYRARCDTWEVRVADLCVETALRSATAFTLAMVTCGQGGARLPSFNELYVLWLKGLEILPTTEEPILTSDFVDDLAVKAPVLSKDGPWNSSGVATPQNHHRYFCVSNPSE